MKGREKEGRMAGSTYSERKERNSESNMDGEGARRAGARGGWLSDGKGRATQDNKAWGARGGRHQVELSWMGRGLTEVG
jgi:hypothetical protein